MDFKEYANRRVLIVDDQKEIHDDFIEMLTPQPSEASAKELAAAFITEEEQSFLPEFELLHARSGEEGCDIVRAGKARTRSVAVAYIDIRMPPGVDGIETIRRIREVDGDVEIVIMTAYTDRSLPEIIQNVEPLHKVLYIRKPFAREEIQQMTLSLVGKWNVEQELAEKRRQLVIGHQRLGAVLDATGEAMAMYDLDERLVFANQGYEKLAELTECELKGLSPEALAKQFQERFQEPDLKDVKSRFILKDEGGDLVEESGAGTVPEQRLFYRTTAPVHDGQGEVMGRLRRIQGGGGGADEGRGVALAHRAGDQPFLRGHGRRQPSHAAGVCADKAGCGKRDYGADPGRERDRQGVGGQVVSFQQPAEGQAVSGHQLRRHSRVPHGK